MVDTPNIFQMYVENGCKYGFFVTRDSWSAGRYAKVVNIDGVEDGEIIKRTPPYFTRHYPNGHLKAGKVWKRYVHLEAPWLDGGEEFTFSGGTYSWTRVYL